MSLLDACYRADNIRLTLLNFGRATVNSEWNGTIISPVFSRLYYIVSGEAYITVNTERLSLSPHRWYLIPTGISFEYECVKEMDHVYFHLQLSDFAEADLLRAAERPFSLDLPPLMRTDAVELRDILRLRQQVFGVVLSFLEVHNINIHQVSYSPYIIKALHYIHQNLSMQLSVSEIAQHSLISPSTLTKRFRRELSSSVSEYIDTLVMTEAEQRLRTDTVSIAAIGEQLGFSDQFYFSKCFKRKFGVSPLEYRNRKSL